MTGPCSNNLYIKKIYADAATNNKKTSNDVKKDLIASSNVHKNPLCSFLLIDALVLVRVPLSCCFPGWKYFAI